MQKAETTILQVQPVHLTQAMSSVKRGERCKLVITPCPEWFPDQSGVCQYPANLVRWLENKKNTLLWPEVEIFSSYFVEETKANGNKRVFPVHIATRYTTTDGGVLATATFGVRVLTLRRNRFDVKTMDNTHIFETWQKVMDDAGDTKWRMTYGSVGESSPFENSDVPMSYKAAVVVLRRLAAKVNRSGQRLLPKLECNKNYERETANPGQFIKYNLAYVVNHVLCAILSEMETHSLIDTTEQLYRVMQNCFTHAHEACQEEVLTNKGIHAGFNMVNDLIPFLNQARIDIDLVIRLMPGMREYHSTIQSFEDFRNYFYSKFAEQ